MIGLSSNSASTTPADREFAKPNFTYTMLSKRRLLLLVNEGVVDAGTTHECPLCRDTAAAATLPKRSVTWSPWSVAKTNSTVDINLLEHCLRVDSTCVRQRRMAVLDPLKVVITNYPEGESEMLDAVINPGLLDGLPANSVFKRDIHRARRLHGRPAKEVLPPRSRSRSEATLCALIKCEKVIKDDSGG
jgi:glutaminyl-tRNA synthetase